MRNLLLVVILVITAGFTSCGDTKNSPANNTPAGEGDYTVSFNSNGGTGGQSATVTATYGQSMPALTSQAPVNEGNTGVYSGGYYNTILSGTSPSPLYSVTYPSETYYEKKYFDGYWDAQTGGKKYYNADLSSAANWDKTADTVLFARWLTVEQKYSITLGNDDFVAWFVDTPPVIDGNGNDPAWAKARWQPIKYQWMYDSGSITQASNAADFSGRFKVVWTANRLYILAEIIDDTISFIRGSTPYTNPENDDCLELFMDENASGGTRTSDGGNNFFTYHMSFGGVNVSDYIGGSSNITNDPTTHIENGNILRNSHFTYVIDKNDTTHTYTWEIEMKVHNSSYPLTTSLDSTPVTLTEGKRMGFAAAYCDSDGPAGGNTSTNVRNHFFGSMAVTGSTDNDRNRAYLDSSQYAKLYLAK